MTKVKKQKNPGRRIPRKLKKQLKKLQAQSNPVKIPKEKKQKLLKLKKKKVTKKPYVKIITPKLPRDVTRKKRYLEIKDLLNGSWANYMNMKAALIAANIISDKAKDKDVDPIINQHLKFFKFVGLKTTEPELTEKILQLQAKRKAANKQYNNRNDGVSIAGSIKKRKPTKKKKKSASINKLKYKWKRLESEVDVDKTKPPIWVSKDIISQVEEKHYFISSAYREISSGSEKLDFHTMQLALEKSNILTTNTGSKSRIIEEYIIFYSFVGLYTDAYDLDAKISDFEKHQIKMKEELMKEKVEYIQFYEIEEMCSYFKRDPNSIEKSKVIEYAKILKKWQRIANEQAVFHPFIDLLEELINNIRILMEENRRKKKKPNNYGKIIHLVKKLEKTQRPKIKQAV